jgi:hypothetical protein
MKRICRLEGEVTSKMETRIIIQVAHGVERAVSEHRLSKIMAKKEMNAMTIGTTLPLGPRLGATTRMILIFVLVVEGPT